MSVAPAKPRPLKAPFPWFGGKSRIAALVWERLGDVRNFVEPFCGSAAMLLLRPTPPQIETINDADCMVANFWRAVQQDAQAVVENVNWPVNEADLHARHRWLVYSDDAQAWRQRMKTDPMYYDARIAGWWCWGLCQWIGGGWCTPHGQTADGKSTNEALPLPGQDGRGALVRGERRRILSVNCPGVGVHRTGERPAEWKQIPALWHPHGHGVHNKLPHISGKDGGTGRGVHQVSGSRIQHGGTEAQRGEKDEINSVSPSLSGEPGLDQRRPHLTGNGGGKVGVNSQVSPDADLSVSRCLRGEGGRPQLADAFSRGRGIHGYDAAETCAARRAWLLDWFGRLRDRLRSVRVCCGDWSRVCSSPSTTTRLGLTGVFLDPPYPTHDGDGAASRDGNLYAHGEERGELDRVRDEVLAWCREYGADRRMRIAGCGYDTDGYAALEADGWEAVAWKTQGGYANRGKGDGENLNAKRERVWFSPGCLRPGAGLFG
jgi:hypothetical protein